jgi:hypothetical protein
MMVATLICGLIVVGLLLSISAAGALAASPTPTPHNNTTTPTPVPTPAPRPVFSAVTWDADHASVQVSNNGEAIEVEASIGTLSNKTTTHVGAGISTKVPTMTISATQGQIIRCWFKAYENGTLIDSMEVPVTVSTVATPTPPPATASLNGIITDKTNNPLVGAQLIFESATWGNKYTAETDGSGQYSVPGMIPDTYKITITAGGYETYRAMSSGAIHGVQQLNPIALQKLPSGTTPTPTPTPVPQNSPSPVPGSPLDAWINLLYNPTICISTLALTLGAIVSATAIYEWIQRQRERRRREAAENKKDTEVTRDTKDSK